MNTEQSFFLNKLIEIDRRGMLVRRRDFGRSLLEQWDTRGSLSEKQWYWVQRIVEENTVGNLPSHGNNTRPSNGPAATDLIMVNEIFDSASEHLKYPKLKVEMADGSDLKLHLAGSRSKYHGAVMLTDGLPFGANKYYGRVENGELHLSREGMDRKDELLSILRSMATDMAGFAAMYGQKTGNCCFCHQELSDDRSIKVGYGPICADHYGLPWGE